MTFDIERNDEKSKKLSSNETGEESNNQFPVNFPYKNREFTDKYETSTDQLHNERLDSHNGSTLIARNED